MAVSLAAGDPKTVRKIMRCSSGDFRRYSDGRKEPPFQEFDRLVGYIVAEQRKIIEKNRDLLAKLRTKPIR